jgi:peptide-methionine (S)-S-oxide reductase
MLEVLDGSLVFLRRFAAAERAEVLPLACLGIGFRGIKAVLARFQLSDHGVPRLCNDWAFRTTNVVSARVRKENSMPRLFDRLLAPIVAATVFGLATVALAAGSGSPLPAPATDVKASSAKSDTAVFAGGCFWGVDAVFRHVKGVTRVVSGYAGGDAKSADYETVSTGQTRHAESVEVTYDPTKVTYGQLLRVFFSVAHDPTEVNRQGPDFGPQYRSAVFVSSDEQKRVAEAYIKQLDAAKVYKRPIATEVTQLPKFYPAESYHQNYLALHPNQPYIVFNDLPKLAELKRQFPDAYVEAKN